MRKPIQTARLMLRDITEADAELLFDLDSDPEVMRYIGSYPPSNVAWYRQRIVDAYLPWQSHPWHGVWIVGVKDSGETLGWTFIRPAPASPVAIDLGWVRPDELEVGYRFRQTAWGRGVATEATAPLIEFALADNAVTSIVACALASNTKSLRVLQKLGLERVGETLHPKATEQTIKLARLK